MSSDEIKKPNLIISIIPLLSLILFLYLILQVFGLGDPHMAIIAGAGVAAGIGLINGYKWEILEEGIAEGIQVGLKAILILMVVGILIATWIASGIVPFLIDMGLGLLHPKIFYVASCAICAVISLATGSSWTTAGTVGVALMGVGSGLGINEAIAAGAIVSGSYFGDKLSPLSDSTNLAPAVAGTDLFTHIRHMLYTTVPAISISLVAYFFIGILSEFNTSQISDISEIRNVIQSNYKLSPILIIAPSLVLIMIWKKAPALPSLFIASLIGILLGIFYQGVEPSKMLYYAFNGFDGDSGSDKVNELLNKGGLSEMMWTISLIFCALGFGGIMMKTHMLEVIALAILKLATSTGKLIGATNMSCIIMNLVAADQYLAIAVPGKMFKSAFTKKGLAPQNLSRCLEDAGTLTSPLIFWNTCGATMKNFLGVAPHVFAPYAFFNWLSPIISLLLAFTGWGITKVKNQD